ncbi:hypothetical protein V1525DRAFT_448981 [Lipomyces kononenkoae]|uniref:Uncharacterized protein n=1 Tax=Lipomyces kononenkoae TaxID=34357 RepID=A0ACC3T6P8_LIPKO
MRVLRQINRCAITPTIVHRRTPLFQQLRYASIYKQALNNPKRFTPPSIAPRGERRMEEANFQVLNSERETLRSATATSSEKASALRRIKLFKSLYHRLRREQRLAEDEVLQRDMAKQETARRKRLQKMMGYRPDAKIEAIILKKMSSRGRVLRLRKLPIRSKQPPAYRKLMDSLNRVRYEALYNAYLKWSRNKIRKNEVPSFNAFRYKPSSPAETDAQRERQAQMLLQPLPSSRFLLYRERFRSPVPVDECLYPTSIVTHRKLLQLPVDRSPYQLARKIHIPPPARLPGLANATRENHDADYPEIIKFEDAIVAKSPALVALHARLGLSKNFPLTTLARALNCESSSLAKIYPNNGSLAALGKEFLELYVLEFIICKYPRLPKEVMNEARWAYVGEDALASIGHHWGVGREKPSVVGPSKGNKTRPGEPELDVATSLNLPEDFGMLKYGRLVVSRVNGLSEYAEVDEYGNQNEYTGFQRYSDAMSAFVRAVVGGIYIHDGEPAAKEFIRDHVLSRKVDVSSLFKIVQPTRELSRLCVREKLAPPISRMIAETGRLSRGPMFVVGVYSGSNVLGTGEGSSIKEAETGAAINALKSWYLYSPRVVTFPSDIKSEDEYFKPLYIDPGQVLA